MVEPRTALSNSGLANVQTYIQSLSIYTHLDPRSRRPHLVESVQTMVEQRMTETAAVILATAELGAASLRDARLN